MRNRSYRLKKIKQKNIYFRYVELISKNKQLKGNMKLKNKKIEIYSGV